MNKRIMELLMNQSLTNDFIEIRKRVLEKEFCYLNNMQMEAVFHINGPLLMLAGAGTGKTTAVVSRIANIIKYGDAYNSKFVPEYITKDDIEKLKQYLDNPTEQGKEENRKIIAVNPAPAYSVMAITFTNKAAGELKERLSKMLGAEAEDIWAFTFHSACVRILRKNIDRLGFNRSFTIYDTDDSQKVIKDCLKELNLNDKNFPPKAVINTISKAKDSLTSPEKFAASAQSDYRLEKIAKVYQLYQNKLKQSNAVDFDDIIYHTVHLLSECEDVRNYYQNRFKYILVDEYQDTSHAQYMLVSLLAGKWKNICVVGDDDQSIYSFRGATIENILSFENQFAGTKVIRLEQNYRSTKNILSCANNVIKNNSGRKSKSLWTENNDGDLINVELFDDEFQESMFIASSVLEGVSKQKRKYSDFAVLYRVNAQSNNIEKMFAKMGIPYRIIGGIRFYERKEIKDAIAYLSVINNPSDNVRLKRIINEPKRGIGTATLEVAEAIAASIGTSVFDVISRANEFEPLKRSAQKLMDFAAIINKLGEKKDQMLLQNLFNEMLDLTGYALSLLNENNDDAKDRFENLKELGSNIVSYATEYDEPTLSGFLEEVSLVSDIDNYDESSDSAVMMTIHSAKGLEFPIVFLPGMEEGLFPSLMSISEPNGVEEERRLAYVAITRAKERLYITHTRERLIYGTTSHNPLSRFVKEIPPKYITSSKNETGKDNVFDVSRSAKQNVKSSLSNAGFGNISLGSVSKETVSFSSGDMVEHAAFGSGMIISAKPMGNDVLLEVAFDNVGTKKLMANYAKLKKKQ